MSDGLDFDYPLTIDDRPSRAAVAEHRDAALRQLGLAGAGDNTSQRLSAATIHVLTSLILLIDDEERRDAELDAKLDAPIPSFVAPRPSRFMVTVDLFHNTTASASADGYTDDVDQVVEVYTYMDHDVPDSLSDREILAGVIEMFGTDPDSADRADHRVANYFDRGNRSIRRGDVVSVDRRFYAFTDTGTTPIAHPRIAVSDRLTPPGTTRL